MMLSGLLCNEQNQTTRCSLGKMTTICQCPLQWNLKGVGIIDTNREDEEVDLFCLKTKRGTSNNLKVVHSGTKKFKIASNKRDFFLGFSEHQERLRKKLAFEEGRIFAANEQLS
ncbi:hypothetical protein HKD37_07G018801 [Glycine soja]